LIDENLAYWKLMDKKQKADMADIELYKDRLPIDKARAVWLHIRKKNIIVNKMIDILNQGGKA
jgi:hypothetical protein